MLQIALLFTKLLSDTIDPIGSPEEVWRNSYDCDLPHSGYNVRQQSSDPMVTTYALRMFAKVLLKRRKRIKPRLSRSDRLNYALLVSREGKEAADRALYGFESDEESEEAADAIQMAIQANGAELGVPV